jgi:hypothetical protein
MRILILTLCCEEAELQRCEAALQQQSYIHWRHRTWSNLGNLAAHKALYCEIARSREEFDLFIKLDADMVLRGHESLRQLVEFFRERPGLDHATFALDDWFSGMRLMGLHAYSNRANWAGPDDALFTDPPPDIPGYRLRVHSAPSPIATHCSDPSPYQAFHFGVHRALKALQPGRFWIRYRQSRIQWRLLSRVWERFEATRDHRIGLALQGAELVWRGGLPATANDFWDPAVRSAFGRYEGLSAEDLHCRLRRTWAPGPRRDGRWLRTVAGRFLLSAMRERLQGRATALSGIVEASAGSRTQP